MVARGFGTVLEGRSHVLAQLQRRQTLLSLPVAFAFRRVTLVEQRRTTPVVII